MGRPLIGITASVRMGDEQFDHRVGDKYIVAVAEAAEGAPVLLPAIGDGVLADWIERLDGLLFTGCPSNVEPHRYGGEPSRPGTLHDARRDATTLPMIRAALTSGVPMLCICRGHQELNVALGGSLHQLVHELPGRRDHRSKKDGPMAVAYAEAHRVRLVPGGVIAACAGGAETIEVNSLHAQAIDRVAPRLVVEAVADDGTIEAVRVADASAFAMGIQWHPEFRARDNPVSLNLFRRFGDAARARAAQRGERAAAE